MKKLIKIFSALFVTLLVIIILMPSLIPANVLRQTLIEQVEISTGMSLSINGEMKAHFFPTAGVSMKDVSLFDPVNPSNKPIITLKSLDVRVGLIPLFRKEVLVNKLALEDPVINLHVDSSGKENWRFTAEEGRPPSQPQAAPASRAGSPAGLKSLQISDVRLSNGSVHYRNDMTGKDMDLSKLDLTLSMSGMNAPLSLTGRGEWQHKVVSVEATINTPHAMLNGQEAGVRFTMDSELLEAYLDGSVMGSGFKGNAHIQSKSLKELMAWIDPASKPSFQSPLTLDLRGDTKCSSQSCQFTTATLSLDDLHAAGSASIDFGARIPYINIDLMTDELDLNPFLPPEPKQGASNGSLISDAVAEDSHGWSREPMDFSVLKSFNATANIKTKGLLVRKIKIGDTILRAKNDKGRLSADVIGARLYSGKGDISIAIDSNTDVVEKRLTLTDVQAAPFLKDAMNEDHLSGTANVQLNIVGKGKSQYDILSSLQGIGNIKFTNGAIKGINIADMVRNVQSAFKPVDRASQKTDFAELGGNITITNGIIKNTDLAMKAPLMRLSGAGQVNLPARTINYRLKPEVVSTIQGQGGKDKQGLGVPVIIEGTIDNPTYRPDLQGVVEDAIKDPQKIKDAVKDVKEQFKGENRKETLKSIRGLLKGN